MQTEPAADRPADVIYEDRQRIRFAPSSRLLALLRDRNIFLGAKSEFVPGPNTVIEIPKTAILEEYCAFPASRRLYTNGAFSYSQSPEPDLVVGRYCSIAHEVSVLGERHPLEWVTTSPLTYQFMPQAGKPAFAAAHAGLMGDAFEPLRTGSRFGPAPVIGNDVWIGQGVQLARGIRIGSGAVVGAGAVVTRDVEPYTIVGGNPARPIRNRFADPVVARLLASAWWDYHPRVLFELDVTRPEIFLDAFERRREAGTLQALQVRRSTWEAFIQA